MDAESLVSVLSPVIESSGLELVDVTFRRETGRKVLRVTIDRPGGLDLDTISEVSEKVSRRLDLERFESGPYALEVSSPGLERSLRGPDEFRRFVGERVRIKTVEPLGGSKVHEGALVSADAEAIVLASASGELRVPYDGIASARTSPDWAEELKRSKT